MCLFPESTMTPTTLAALSRRALLVDLSRVGCAALMLGASHAARSVDLPEASSAQPDTETLRILRSRIELQFAPGFSKPLQAAARAWVITSADAVARYFGRFPAPKVELLLVPEQGSGVRSGVTYAEPSLLMRIRLGRDTTEAQFIDDSVLVHEMVHLAIPRIPRAQNWLHEGIATYVESVARGRVGLISAETVWREWARAMPQGQPQAGDAGLDHTPTWGRTYWGGAMFCLLADVELLKRSQLRTGLQDALQGVLAAGGQYGVPWTVERILATADAAVGQTALTELYERMKASAEPVDLAGLWRDLGITGGTLNDKAPLANVRRAILA
jgi:hypothetical protein